MTKKVRVTILDDHQSIIDGYMLRLNASSQVEVAATILFGEELEPILEAQPTDVLILDVGVQNSAEDENPYPILHVIPKLLQKYPGLNILVISMHAERRLIRAVMEAGASGYILKEDWKAMQNLANVVISIADGGIYFSQKAHELVLKGQLAGDKETLTARQKEVLSLCAAYPNDTLLMVAQKIGVTHSTVRNLLSTAYLNLGVNNKAGAIIKARQMGLITPEPPTVATPRQ